jgi:hypothetical protein
VVTTWATAWRETPRISASADACRPAADERDQHERVHQAQAFHPLSGELGS